MGAHLLIEIDDFIRKRSCGPPRELRELRDAKRAGGQVQSPGGWMPSGSFMVVLCDLFGGLGSVGLGSLWAGRGGANIVCFLATLPRNILGVVSTTVFLTNVTFGR